jgi:hypothetical protein
MWGKAKCPICGKVIDQWNAMPTDGSGSIVFDDKTGEVDVSDVIVNEVDFICPTDGCTFVLLNVSTDDLKEWFEEHRVNEEAAE